MGAMDFARRRALHCLPWRPMIRLKSLPSLFTALALLAGSAAVSARDMVAVSRPEINMRSGAGTQHEAL